MMNSKRKQEQQNEILAVLRILSDRNGYQTGGLNVEEIEISPSQKRAESNWKKVTDDIQAKIEKKHTGIMKLTEEISAMIKQNSPSAHTPQAKHIQEKMLEVEAKVADLTSPKSHAIK